MQLKNMKEQSAAKQQEDGQAVSKRWKRQAYDQTNSVKKPSKSKSQIENQMNKITKYFTKPLFCQNQNTEQSQPIKRQGGNKIDDLQQKIKQKDRLINQLKIKKQDQEQRINRFLYEARQFKKKNKLIVAASMLQLAQIRRAQLYKKDQQIENYLSNGGTVSNIGINSLSQLRYQIQYKKQALQKLKEIIASKTITAQQITRNTYSIQFIHQELVQLRKQLQCKQKQVAVYKDRMKLVQKQKRSLYFLQGWPLIYQRYQTLFLLGSGGFGQVYKCYDIQTNRFVAIKIIDLENKNIDYQQREGIFKHLRREVQIQRQINHPNIVKFNNLIQLDQAASQVVFEIEYCYGVQLSVYLRKYQCIEQREAKSIIKQLFSAISYLYSLKEKVIHFDLKPTNIMLCSGLAKIMDFGLSKIIPDNQHSNMELTSQGMGTFWYLPPQTFQSDSPKVSCKVDVWSLGVIFFQILYGRKPFGHGIPQSQVYQMGIILKAFKPQFPKENPKKYKISQGAMDFISLCLKYNPSDRPTPLEAYQHPYLFNQ